MYIYIYIYIHTCCMAEAGRRPAPFEAFADGT